MPSKIYWTRQSREDLRAVRAHIARDAPATASAYVRKLRLSVGRLKQFPYSGAVVPEIGREDLREVLQGNYRIIYRVSKADHREAQRDQRKIRKEITNCERSIARLDEQKRGINAQLLQATDPQEAMRLHNELEVITSELAAAEERWCELQQQQTDDE